MRRHCELKWWWKVGSQCPTLFSWWWTQRHVIMTWCVVLRSSFVGKKHWRSFSTQSDKYWRRFSTESDILETIYTLSIFNMETGVWLIRWERWGYHLGGREWLWYRSIWVPTYLSTVPFIYFEYPNMNIWVPTIIFEYPLYILSTYILEYPLFWVPNMNIWGHTIIFEYQLYILSTNILQYPLIWVPTIR